MSVLASPPSAVNAAGSWAGGTNTFASDNTYATLSTTSSSSLDVGGFNFASIPAGSTINSVTVAVEHFESQTNQINFSVVVLDGATTIDTLSPTLKTVEGTDNLAMASLPSLAQLQSANFQVRLTGGKQGGGGSRSFTVDFVQVTVDYTAPAPVTGTLAATNSDDSFAASGLVANPVTGTLTATNSSDTFAASGAETFSGTMSVANGSDTMTASGAEIFSGTLAATNANDSATATGTVVNPISSTLSATNADDTFTASGASANPITGTFVVAHADDTMVAAGASVDPVYLFTPPTHEEPMRTERTFLRYYRLTYSSSVLRVDGVFQSIRTPSPPLIEAAGTEGVDYFRGGCIYEVSPSTAAELQAAGYEVTLK